MKKIKNILIVIAYAFYAFLLSLTLGDFIFGADVVNESKLLKAATFIISIVFTIYTSILFYKKLTLQYPKGKSLVEFPNSYVVFNIETTGLKKDFNEIIEIGAIKVIEGNIVEEFNKFIKPVNAVSDKITKSTGITNSMLETKEDFLVIGNSFNDFVEDYIVVVHDANFNVDFMYKYYIDYNVGIFNNDFIDTLMLSKMLIKDSDNYKLETLLNYFKFEKLENRSAMADTINTYKLLLELEKIYKDKPSLIPFEIKTYQTIDINKVKSEILTENIDKKNPFFNLNVCYTSEMKNFTKQELGQIIVNLGGKLQDNVTHKTDILIVGDVEKNIQMHGARTRQHKRAMKLINNGQEIKIIKEKDLLELLE